MCKSDLIKIYFDQFSLFHWLYTQNGLNLFSRWQHSKKMLTKKEIIATSLFVSNIFYYLCTIRVITLKHNNEELRNTNGCYLVTQFSSNPTNRFILSKLSFLAKVTKIYWWCLHEQSIFLSGEILK